MTHLLLTGASGFVGGAVRRALLARGVRLRTLVHRRPVGGEDERVADLADPGSLRGVCDGMDGVVHLASAVGADAQTCRAVNADGVRALLAEAESAGVRRFVQLGTAAVYGRRAQRGPAENEVTPGPASVTSSARLEGENSVLEAGGTVVRPYFVYGAGDRWVIPGLARLLTSTRSTIEGGAPRWGMVWVEDLGELIARLALHPPLGEAGRVFHACHPRPVQVRELIERLISDLEVPAPQHDLSHQEALEALPGAADQVALLARDRFFDSTAIWRTTAATPTSFEEGFLRSTAWYREFLAHGTRTRP